MEPIMHTAVNHGGVLPAFELYLLERSLATLALRMAQHNRNAQAVAEYLAGHPRARRVFFPGLPNHPGHAVARRQMSGFGGMLSVDLDCDHAAARKIVERLTLITHAVSLGGWSPWLAFRS
jgi:cystathionine beta-lyase/cystathionine gamma-synthase